MSDARTPLPESAIERNAIPIQRAVMVICALLVVADVAFSVFGHRHTHFGFEGYVGVYGAIGFVSYVGLVLSAKLLRKLVMRPEGFYDPPPPSVSEAARVDEAPREAREEDPS